MKLSAQAIAFMSLASIVLSVLTLLKCMMDGNVNGAMLGSIFFMVAAFKLNGLAERRMVEETIGTRSFKATF